MPIVTRRTANVVAGLLALALIAGLVIRTSSAVFTANTDNTGNSLEAGTIVLTDDDSGTVLFSMENVAPGEFAVECIRVTYSGSLDPEAVKFYSTSTFATAPDTTLNMENQVLLTIEESTAAQTGTFNGCPATFSGTTITGPDETLASWHGAHTNYANGETGWNPPLPTAAAPTDSRLYRVTLELDETTGNAFQGQTLSGISIAWATQSEDNPGEVPARP